MVYDIHNFVFCGYVDITALTVMRQVLGHMLRLHEAGV